MLGPTWTNRRRQVTHVYMYQSDCSLTSLSKQKGQNVMCSVQSVLTSWHGLVENCRLATALIPHTTHAFDARRKKVSYYKLDYRILLDEPCTPRRRRKVSLLSRPGLIITDRFVLLSFHPPRHRGIATLTRTSPPSFPSSPKRLSGLQPKPVDCPIAHHCFV